MTRPTVLLLDEPSLGLAPILVQQIFTIIREINERGMTILLVEQNALQALSIANRGYVLQTGEVVLVGRLAGPDGERDGPQGLPRRGLTGGASPGPESAADGGQPGGRRTTRPASRRASTTTRWTRLAPVTGLASAAGPGPGTRSSAALVAAHSSSGSSGRGTGSARGIASPCRPRPRRPPIAGRCRAPRRTPASPAVPRPAGPTATRQPAVRGADLRLPDRLAHRHDPDCGRAPGPGVDGRRGGPGDGGRRPVDPVQPRSHPRRSRPSAGVPR